MTTFLLILHGLMAVALMGAITHQTITVWWPAAKRTGSFATSLRTVPGTSYTVAIVVLFIVTAIFGSIIYAEFRVVVRPMLQNYRMFAEEGAFEVKEHVLAIAFGLLPAYWYYWRAPQDAAHATARAMLTALICAAVWYGWIATSALASTAIAIAALAIPARLLDKALPRLVWLVPIVAILAFLYILKGYFLR
jgi:hypothetical protein